MLVAEAFCITTSRSLCRLAEQLVGSQVVVHDSCAKTSPDLMLYHQSAYPESSVELQSYLVLRVQVLGIIHLIS